MKRIPTGKCLVIMVGPCGAGKSYFTNKHFEKREIVRSDDIRTEFAGDFMRLDKDNLVFQEFHRRIAAKLDAGQRVVADATNLRNKDRRDLAKIGHEREIKVIYVVVNRDIRAKHRHGGWRNDIIIKNRTLIEKHEETFQSNEAVILDGDGGTAEVIDTRTDQYEVCRSLVRNPSGVLDDLLNRGFEYIRVIGDVHGNIAGLRKALAGRDDRGVTFNLFLGDIVDHGVGSLTCAEIISNLVNHGEAICVRGNHDKKIARWIQKEREGGFLGELTYGMDVTVNQIKARSPTKRRRWEERFLSLVDLSPDWLQINDDTLFVHAASHPRMWNNLIFRAPPETSLEVRALYGEVTGEKDPKTGFPLRYFNWVDEIPYGKTVYVGHYVMSQEHPVIKKGKQGGKVVFLDTGSSKIWRETQKLGKISWADLNIFVSNSGYAKLQFKEFGSE